MLMIPAALALATAAAACLLWPVMAFVWYVRLCGPDFRSSIDKSVVMVAVMCAPMAIVYQWRAPW